LPRPSIAVAGFGNVTDTGLVAALALWLSATPNQQCAREPNQLAAWPLVGENTSYAVCPARPVIRSGWLWERFDRRAGGPRES